MGNTIHERVREYCEKWEHRCYTNGIPDEAPVEIADKVPCYKKIAIAILKNDLNLSSLGYEKKHSKYYDVLKRIEMDARKDGKPKQLKFNL